MFSKALAFGLGALALVRAAPALSVHNHMISCNTNFPTPVAPVKSFDTIEPGRYAIYNEAMSAQLRAYVFDEQIFVSLTREWAGDFAVWDIQPRGSYGYTITNVGLEAATQVAFPASRYFKGKIFTTSGPGQTFYITSAGEGYFNIKIPTWTWCGLSIGESDQVYLKPADGGDETRWTFTRVDDD
ncbi:hypothetical protein C8R45DRAFT_1093701 [Mycena sanguinolenta]|nr:hypothetical protein C8R45DRAFT_1093701 [Mycena sanguinolenta]